MKKLLSILFFFTLNTALFAQENPENETVYMQIGEDRSIAPALTELKPNQFLQYTPNLPSGTFIGVQKNRGEFDMVGIINEENRKREMAKAERLADINLPQMQFRKEEKAIQFTGNNPQETQLNNGINNFNNNSNSTNPFYQYHNTLYNNTMRGGYYSRPYSYTRRYNYY